MKSRRRASLIPWLVAALLLHGVTLGVWRVTRQPAATAAASAPDVKWLEVQVEPAVSSQSLARVARAADDAGAVDPLRGSAVREPVLPRAVAAALGNGRAATERPAAGASPIARADDSQDTTVAPSDNAVPASQIGEPAPPTKSLSLAELGIGAPNAAAIQPYLAVRAEVSAQERLDKHLAQAILDQDRDHSLGIEGPITRALHTAAMSVVAPDSLAKVVIVIGADGKLADFRILESNQDAQLLRQAGERLKGLLASQQVRVPAGRAVEFTYELRSEVLLPSGRAPGVAVSVLGIPIKRGRNKKSSRISLLEPQISFGSKSLPDPERNGQVTQTAPQLAVGFTVLGIGADPVDIGAAARQVIHTRLIQQRVL